MFHWSKYEDDFESRSIASTDSIDGAEVNDSDPDDINKGRNNFLTIQLNLTRT